MKTGPFTAAALVGAASAGSSADWASWDPETTTTTTSWEWDPSTSTTTSGWDWPVTTTTTTSDWEFDPATTSSSSGWADWTTTTSKSTTWGPYDPESSDCTATTTYWAKGTTTSTAWAYETVTAWEGDVTSTVYVTVTSTLAAAASSWSWAADPAATSSWAWSADPSLCSVSIATSTGSPVWSPDPEWTSYSTVYVAPVTTSSTSTWGDWELSTTATTTPSAAWPTWSDPASSTEGWAWSSSSASASYTWTSSAAASVPTLGGSGNTWAMTYSPYTASSGCKDQGTISADIAVIASKGFTSVRVYSTDCKTLEYVGQACRDHGMKLILGVFISSTGINGAQQQVTDILAWAQWDLVELIVVGNEAVFNNYCSASDLAWFITDVKGKCSGAGYTGPVTTTEPLSTWQSVGTTFCSAVDVVAANLYAFFNAATTCDQAGTFIQSEITLLEGICSSKDVYVMETGWPNAGECNGVACPGVSEQATAIKGIQETSGAKVVFFSYEDDAWKEPGPFGVEQHWGCVDIFGSSTSSSAPATSSAAW